MYSPINEQGVVYLFGLIANDLNIRVESIQQGYPDCTAIKYVGKGRWERINIEFEFKNSNFDHGPDKCDVLVCWEDNLQDSKRDTLKGLEIIELQSIIGTPEVPDIPLKDPEKEIEKKSEYDLEYHFKRKKTTKKIQELYQELDEETRKIDDSIWVKYARTAITYYSPEKMFVYMRLRKDSLAMNIFTDQEKIESVRNIKDHENWGKISLKNKEQMPLVISAIQRSFKLMKEEIKDNKNTGWYALTPRDVEHVDDESV